MRYVRSSGRYVAETVTLAPAAVIAAMNLSTLDLKGSTRSLVLELPGNFETHCAPLGSPVRGSGCGGILIEGSTACSSLSRSRSCTALRTDLSRGPKCPL